MSRFPRRGRIARLALGLVALGVPLVGANTAQAALGTSSTFTPQNRPFLQSVTITGPGLVNFCFGTSGGQAVTAPGGTYDPNDFRVAGYKNTGNQAAATVAQFNNNCVQASYALGQLSEYSFGAVDDNAVVAIISGNPVGNLEDAAPLIGSSSNNGTRNFTTGLDLVNVLSPGSNRLAFVFDQDVRQDSLPAGCPGAGCGTQDFLFYDGAGNLHGNGGAAVISISDNIVVVQYANPPDPVADARIGLVRHNSEVNATDLRADTPFVTGQADRVTLGSAAVAGVPGSGNTAMIEATGAALVNNGNSNQINFTFETNVALGPSAPGCFTATMSEHSRLFGDSASVNGNVVTVTFNGMQEFSEYAVRAGIQEPDPNNLNTNCVQSPTSAVGNTMGSQAVGGNVGAVATGYSTGPDALGGSKSGGNVTVPVDSRVDPNTINLGGVTLLDDQGNPIGGAPSNASVTGNGAPTDPHVVTFTFDPVAVAAARGLQLSGPPFFGNGVSLGSFPTNSVDEFSRERTPTQTFALSG
jgi:hypothetical protein